MASIEETIRWEGFVIGFNQSYKETYVRILKERSNTVYLVAEAYADMFNVSDDEARKAVTELWDKC